MLTIDWGNTYKIQVPQSYLTLISGTLYELDTDQFRLDLKGLEASENGIPFPKTHDHNTQYTIAGVTYSRSIEILAPYSVEFEDGAYSVRLTGSNNNIWDIQSGILVQNQVQVIPTNSAGLVVVSAGASAAAIADAVWDEVIDNTNHNGSKSAGQRLRQSGAITSADGQVDDVGATTTSFITNLTQIQSNFYNDQLIVFTSGALEGQVGVIQSYDGGTKTITLDEALTQAPSDADDFIILSTHVHPISQIASGVWDKDISGYTTDGIAGYELQIARLKAALAAALSA